METEQIQSGYSEESLNLINRTMTVGLPALEHFFQKTMKHAWAIYNPIGMCLFSSRGFKRLDRPELEHLSVENATYHEGEKLLLVPVFYSERDVQLFVAVEQVTPGKTDICTERVLSAAPAMITYFSKDHTLMSGEPKYFDHVLTMKQFDALVRENLMDDGLYCVTVVRTDLPADRIEWKQKYMKIWQNMQMNHHRLCPMAFSGYFVGIVYAGADEGHPSLEYRVHQGNPLQFFENQFELPCSGCTGMRYPKEKLVQSYREALFGLTLGYAFGKQEFYHQFSDLGIFRFWQSHDRGELKTFCRGILEPLERYDCEKEKSGDLRITLDTLVNSEFNIKDTTEQLGINKTTLYYRLGRIEKLLGQNVTSEIGRLNAVFAIKGEYILKETEPFESD